MNERLRLILEYPGDLLKLCFNVLRHLAPEARAEAVLAKKSPLPCPCLVVEAGQEVEAVKLGIAAERVESHKLLDDLGVVVYGHLLLAACVFENKGLYAGHVGEHFGDGDTTRSEEARVAGVEAVLVAVAVVVEYDYSLVAAEEHALAAPRADELYA